MFNKYILILLLLLPVLSIAQEIEQKNDYEPNFKSKLSLDLFPLGGELTYKRKFNKQWFWGVGLGSNLVRLRPIYDKNSFKKFELGFILDFIRLKPLIDYELNQRWHFSLGLPTTISFEFYNDDHTFAHSIEFGVFYQIWKQRLELGIMPSLIMFNNYDSDVSFGVGVVPFVVRIPLKRWE